MGRGVDLTPANICVDSLAHLVDLAKGLRMTRWLAASERVAALMLLESATL